MITRGRNNIEQEIFYHKYKEKEYHVFGSTRVFDSSSIKEKKERYSYERVFEKKTMQGLVQILDFLKLKHRKSIMNFIKRLEDLDLGHDGALLD